MPHGMSQTDSLKHASLNLDMPGPNLQEFICMGDSSSDKSPECSDISYGFCTALKKPP